MFRQHSHDILKLLKALDQKESETTLVFYFNKEIIIIIKHNEIKTCTSQIYALCARFEDSNKLEKLQGTVLHIMFQGKGCPKQKFSMFCAGAQKFQHFFL